MLIDVRFVAIPRALAAPQPLCRLQWCVTAQVVTMTEATVYKFIHTVIDRSN
jgi:hypothetical protein